MQWLAVSAMIRKNGGVSAPRTTAVGALIAPSSAHVIGGGGGAAKSSGSVLAFSRATLRGARG